jgi:phage-related protein
MKEAKEVSEKDAVEMLTKSNKETILKAIGTLNEVLKASEEADKAKAEVGSKVEHTKKLVGQKEVSLKVFNKAIRELLKAKKSL